MGVRRRPDVELEAAARTDESRGDEERRTSPNLAWTQKDKRLEQDHLLVEVEVWAEGIRKRSGEFLIRNPNQSLANFEIARTDA